MKQAQELARELSRLYWALTALALLGLGGDVLLHRLRGPLPVPPGGERLWGVVVLVLAVAFGVALPILIRALFNGRAVREKRVDLEAFVRYQRALVVVPLLAAFVAAAAVLFPLGRLHLYGSVLAALYGAYGAWPAQRKIAGEMRYYGLAPGGPKSRGA